MAGADSIKGIFVAVLVIGVIAIIGMLLQSKFYNTAMDSVDYTTTAVTNESIASVYLGVYSPLTYSNEIVCTQAFNESLALHSANYSCTNSGFLLLSNGAVPNGSTVKVTYTYGADTAYHTSFRNIDSTVFDAYDLGIIALIVLAAVFVLLIVGMIAK